MCTYEITISRAFRVLFSAKTFLPTYTLNYVDRSINENNAFPPNYCGEKKKYSPHSHLQDAHPKGVSEDLVRLLVVAVPNVRACYEQFKRVILVNA